MVRGRKTHTYPHGKPRSLRLLDFAGVLVVLAWVFLVPGHWFRAMSPDSFDLQPLMPGFLAELGVTTNLSKQEAGLALARLVAQAIVDGCVKPYEGARFIWREIEVDLWPNPLEELMPFVGNASEYEDCEFYGGHPEEVRKKIADDIVEDARKFVGTGVQS